MRTGAAGVLAGFGGGSGHTTAAVLGVAVPMATAIADVAAARRDYLDESGGRYVHVIADGGMTRSGDIAKALALGADAVMVGSPFARASQAPGRGYHWGSEAHHPDLPRGARLKVGTIGTLEQILHGPSTVADGSMNLHGRTAPHDGDLRLLRPEGVPAGGGRGDAECHAALTSGSGRAPAQAASRPGTGTRPADDPALATTRLGPAERSAALEALASNELQVLVVGGGVVGAGVALDAVTRGLTAGLVEARDFGSGTSSRSSKLIHGGLRYLEQLNVGLVREALSERSLLLQRLAPHLVRPVSFLFPFTHHGWERAYVGAGSPPTTASGSAWARAAACPATGS